MFETKKNKMMQRLLMIAIMMIGLFFLNPNQAAAQRINIAVGKTATQSSTLGNPCNPGANKAVDGNDDGNFNNCSVTHTNLEDQAWWQVDLQNELTITQIELNNRTDCCGERLFPKEGGVQFPFEIKFSSDGINWTPYNDSMIDNSGMVSGSVISESISVALKNVKARFVRVQLRGTGFLSLAEVKVFVDATTVAKITNYDVSKSGWTFRNFGPSSTEDNDLSAVDLIQMFGAKNVCIKGSTADDCVLYETAEKWRQEKINGAGKGHCLGMSISSLRLMRGIAFRGKTKPADWKADATVTGNLVRDSSIDNYITYFQIAQGFDEIWNNVSKTTTKSPSETLKFITDTLKGGNAFVALAFWQKGYQRGHAVVPYKVVDLGNDDFRIYIYDNNYPNDTGKFVAVNTKTETWSYRTASDPAKAVYDYVGDAESQTLATFNLSDFEKSTYTCPFASAENGTSNSAASLRFSTTREGDFVMTDTKGRSIGFNPVSNHLFKDIPGGMIEYDISDNENEALAPAIKLPINSGGTDPYTVTLFGKAVTTQEDEDFEITGPGFDVGFEHILLDPNEILTISVSPDGKQLSFTTSADGQTPTVYFTTESGHNAPSYIFEIGGVQIDAGKTLTATLDLANGHIFFKDNDGRHEKYTIKMTRINPDGTRDEFEEDELDIGTNDSVEMDFGKWDGKSPMDFEEDENGDGFDDEKPIQKENQAQPKKVN